MKRLTCSKKILLVSYFCAISLTLAVLFGTLSGYEMSNISNIAALAWGEVAVSNAFYYKKAEKENTIKIAVSLAKKYGLEFDLNNVFHQ